MSVAGSLRESASSSLAKAAEAVGLNNSSTSSVASEDSNSDALEELSEYCPKLTYQQRVVGFFSCFGFGYLITFLSFGFFIKLVEGNPVPFVLVYTVGNICSIFSATFLCGPKRQFKRMFHDTRKWTTIIYVSTLSITLVVCFIPGIDSVARLLILVTLLCIQFCASLWYSLSYLPFARRAVLNCLKEWA